MNNTFDLVKIVFLIQVTLLTGNSVIIPRVAVLYSKTGAWLPIFVDMIIASLIGLIYIHLSLKYENCTIYEYSEQLVGKLISKIIITLYIVYFFFEFNFITNTLAYVMKSYYLVKTPLWFLFIFTLCIVFFLLSYNFNTLCKCCVITTIFAYCSVSVVIFLGISKVNTLNLYPIIPKLSLQDNLQSLFIISKFFFGVQILSILTPSKDIPQKKYLKYATASICTAGIVFIVFTELTLATIGVNGATRYTQPILIVSRNAEAGFYQAKGRIDGILIIGYILFLFSAIAINVYCASLLTKKMFTKLPFRLIILSFLILSFTFYILSKNQSQVFNILKLVKYVGLITAILIPISLFFISKIRKVKI